MHQLFLSKKDGKYGYVDKKGNVVVDYIYDDATEQNKYGYAGVKKDGKLELSVSPDMVLDSQNTMLVLGRSKNVQKCFHI